MIPTMRYLLALLVFVPLLAAPQEGPGPGGRKEPPAPKNLKLLQPSEVRSNMHAFTTGLGVRCDYCHVRGNFASDDNPHKEIARKMIVLVREVNAKFPDGKTHVTCYTCHRGAEEPKTEAPAATQQ